MSNHSSTGQGFEERRVWDGPTRLFHWALVVSVAAGWLIGKTMSFGTIGWHFWLGYTTGGLVVFRLVWGTVGPPPSRLAVLFPAPSSVARYLRHVGKREPGGVAGHSPLGALSVLALLAALLVQVITGLFSSSDAFFTEGPLADKVPGSVVLLANQIHGLNAWVLAGLVGLHVAALMFYLVWKHENLVRPMITGIKKVRF